MKAESTRSIRCIAVLSAMLAFSDCSKLKAPPADVKNVTVTVFAAPPFDNVPIQD